LSGRVLIIFKYRSDEEKMSKAIVGWLLASAEETSKK